MPVAKSAAARPRSSGNDGESDLRQFLKISNPVWSISRRGGGNDVNRVVEKLRCIGVTDAGDLLGRVVTNRINGDLKDAGFTRFSQDTLESIRKQGSFVRAVQTLTEAGFRQTGDFAKVPRLLSSQRAPPSRDGTRSLTRPRSEPAGCGDERRRGGRAGGASAAGRPATSSAVASPSASAALLSSRGREDHFPPPPGGRPASAGRVSADVVPGALWSAPVVSATSFEAASPAPDGRAGWPPEAREGSVPLARVRLRGAARRSPRDGRRPATCPQLRLTPSTQPTSVACPESTDATVSLKSAEDCALRARTSPRLRAAVVAIKGARRASSFSASPSRAASKQRSEDDQCYEEDLPVQIEHMRKQVGDMDQRLHEEMASGGANAASWCALRCSGSLLHQAEEVLREQHDHEERRELSRIMDREGLVSPLRKVIAENVRARLVEEQKEDDAEAYAVAQKCINIRKQLTYMANSRRELALLKRAVEGTRDFGGELALLKSPVVRGEGLLKSPKASAPREAAPEDLDEWDQHDQHRAAAGFYRGRLTAVLQSDGIEVAVPNGDGQSTKSKRPTEKWSTVRRRSSVIVAASALGDAAEGSATSRASAELASLPEDGTAEAHKPTPVKMSTLRRSGRASTVHSQGLRDSQLAVAAKAATRFSCRRSLARSERSERSAASTAARSERSEGHCAASMPPRRVAHGVRRPDRQTLRRGTGP